MEGFNNVYRGKTVLVTGHTGFKGSWLSIWLNELGANVIGYALDNYTDRGNFYLSDIGSRIVDIRGDIRDFDSLKKVFDLYKPEFVFHLAAQPLVRLSYEKPVETYSVNVMGTVNVLEAIKVTESVRVGIMITTDKCYENKEQIWGYRESDQLGGYDPYSSSKACAELAIRSWRLSFFGQKTDAVPPKAIASARAGNVIGGGDWGLDRLVPDCIRAIEKNMPVVIRNPESVRPWQHVLEPLSGYLLLGEKMHKEPSKYSEAWNFGPEIGSLVMVQELVERIITAYGRGSMQIKPTYNIKHETGLLNLDITKSVLRLGWKPRFNLAECIDLTTSWYRNYRNLNVYQMCVDQINKIMDKIDESKK